MPVPRLTGHRLRSGLWTADDLTDTYAISALPVQTDQGFLPWVVNGQETLPPTPARITTNADLSKSPDGFYAWAWAMDMFSFEMLDYWLDTFLPDDVDSAEVSGMTYDERENPFYFQALINRPRPGTGLSYLPGGWAVVWQFTRGVKLPPPE